MSDLSHEKLYVSDTLIELGITPNKKEFSYWYDLIVYYMENPKSSIMEMYINVSKGLGLAPEGLRNALCRSLKKTWEDMDDKKQDDIFGYVIKSTPDNGSFLRMIAEKANRDKLLREVYCFNDTPEYEGLDEYRSPLDIECSGSEES